MKLFLTEKKNKQYLITTIKEMVKEKESGVIKLNKDISFTIFNEIMQESNFNYLHIDQVSLNSVRIKIIAKSNKEIIKYIYMLYEEFNVDTLKKVLDCLEDMEKNGIVPKIKPKRYNGDIELTKENEDYFSELEILNGNLKIQGINAELPKLHTLNGVIKVRDLYDLLNDIWTTAELKILNLTDFMGLSIIKISPFSNVFLNEKINEKKYIVRGTFNESLGYSKTHKAPE